MKKTQIYLFRFQAVFLPVLSILLSACVKRDLDRRSEEQEPEITITLNWNNGYIPSGTRFHFYHENGTSQTVDCSATGFKGKLPKGIYQVLAYNTDATGVEHASLERYEKAHIRALPETPARGQSGTLCHVRNVYCVAINRLTVEDGPQQHTVIPRKAEKTISFRYKTKGINDIAAMKSTLTGVVPAIYHHTGESTGELCQSVVSEISTAGDEYTSQVRVLGLENNTVISVEILHSDGSSERTLPHDIGQELEGYREGDTIEIDLQTDGGELIAVEVDVENWQNGGEWWLDIENKNSNI